ncbi:YicC family protein [Virgibacillus dakarensis]|uniref:YicC family protein n=1 Tax=Lentibacillus populi TaxID=1827502 RepID=A0A9W5X3X7_9BACI|nr:MULTISPECIES: YicC/YloC family endoribonuclease [Bacillaceae]MBT2216898.1 YicC family protein [Virgibacillus dakarensis]MTW85304.1 YicC family protein [Virgibacillus dakarensis]GGB29679.1 hypothetical protein GCM10011409_03740 [Lentibacillus populi]
MVRSMTGYGRDVVHIGKTTVTVEIKSVNHRFLDFNIKIPHTLLLLEEKIKEIVRSFFNRGRIELYISVDGEGFAQNILETDWKLLDQYMGQLQQVKERYQLTGEIPMSTLLSIPELFSVRQTAEQSELELDMVIKSIEAACVQVKQMRENEGEKLLTDIVARMNIIRELVSSLKTRREHVIDEYRERISARIEDHLDGAMDIDKSRLYQEIALLAEKGDITEEITRLGSHIDQFFTTIEKDGQVGRRLDFILQEMHRETNTIGSKSTDPKISEWVVSIKSELEKMKEQVQNIE